MYTARENAHWLSLYVFPIPLDKREVPRVVLVRTCTKRRNLGFATDIVIFFLSLRKGLDFRGWSRSILSIFLDLALPLCSSDSFRSILDAIVVANAVSLIKLYARSKTLDLVENEIFLPIVYTRFECFRLLSQLTLESNYSPQIAANQFSR